MEAILETLSIINNPGLQSMLTPFKWIFGIIGILLLLFCVYVLFRTMWMKFAFLFDFTEFFTFRPYGLQKKIVQWQKIKARLESANEAEYKLAIIEADSMLNDILFRMGFKGETLGDRLKILTTAIVPNLHDVAKAHETRNSVVRDPDYHLILEETQRTLAIYEIAFSNLDLV